MTPDGLVALVIIDHNVRLADGPDTTKVDGVWTEVGVREQRLAIPSSSVLRGKESAAARSVRTLYVPHPRSGTGRQPGGREQRETPQWQRRLA